MFPIKPSVAGVVPFAINTRYHLRPGAIVAPQAAPMVLLLHGQGMHGEQMLRLGAPGETSQRHWLAPDGPYPVERRRPERIDIGHAWYMYDGDQSAFRRELERTEAHVLRVLDQVCGERAVDPNRVTLAGYSQGGYLAGFVALRNRDRFRGLVIANARLKHEFLEQEIAAGGAPAVLMVHSPEDQSVRWESAEPGVALLRAAGATVEIQMHEQGHRVARDLGARIERFLDANQL